MSIIKRSKVSTLSSVFEARVHLTPKQNAFRFFDQQSQCWQNINWLDAYKQILKIRKALSQENLQVGDRILLAVTNSPDWVYIEQAALNMGLVIVALPPSMPTTKICKIVENVDAKIVFIESDNIWHSVYSHPTIKQKNITVVCRSKQLTIKSVLYISQWQNKSKNLESASPTPEISDNTLATIVYTSGSCGKPKGVKHSHKNLINNAFACLERINIDYQDQLLSVTPISHCMERVAGYYAPIIAGASIVFPRSQNSILEDLRDSKATILITTPHYLTRAYKRLLNSLIISARLTDQYLDYLQGINKWQIAFIFWPIIRFFVERKAKKYLLHQLRFVMCGGSALSPKIISLSDILNLPVLQGYGLTEAGGVVSTNSTQHNRPLSVGKALGNVRCRLSNEHELSLQSDSLMLGYWGDENSTLKPDDWLETKDLVRMEDNYLFVEGRQNRTLHLSTGEIIYPLPIEKQLAQNALFDQVMLYGENQEQVSLLCQLNLEEWRLFRKTAVKRHETEETKITEKLKDILLLRVNLILRALPDQPVIPVIFFTLTPWSLENGMINGMGKVNRKAVEVFFAKEISTLR